MSEWKTGRGERGALTFVQSLKMCGADKAKAVAQWFTSEDVGIDNPQALAQFDISLFAGSPVPLAMRTALIAAAQREVEEEGGAAPPLPGATASSGH